MEFAAKLSNDWQVCHLLDLKGLPVRDRSGLTPGADGPFGVMQRAYDPEDPKLEADDFMLTREGRWMPLYAMLALPEEEREALLVFTTAAEAIQTLANLRPEAVIDRARIPASGKVAAGAPVPADEFSTGIIARRDNARPLKAG